MAVTHGKGTGRQRARGLARALLAACVLALLVPLVAAPLYRFGEPVSTTMLARIATGQPVTRIWRPLDTMSDRLKASIVSSEDGQFCRHSGVDVKALSHEVDAMLKGGTPRGASTITMQVARNLFLWNGRSVVRKALEIPLAFYLDLVLPKRRILEIYLNIAEWGPEGQFGVEAGAEAAFGIDADAFSWRQAALLTAALPNPHVRLPGRPGPRMRAVAGIIEARAKRMSPYLTCLYANGSVPKT